MLESVSAPDVDRADAHARAEDTRARQAARTVFDRPVVLEAGAGTGKTTALVARVVAWLIDAGFERARTETKSDDPARIASRAIEGVLAITFTEAAAADMDSKIRSALAEIEQGRAPVGMQDHVFLATPAERRARAAQLRVALERPLALTIHAWCQKLLAEHPLEAGLHPGFTVDAPGRVVEEVVDAAVTEELHARLGAEPDADWLLLAARNFGPGAVTRAVTQLVVAGHRAEDLGHDPFPPAVIERIDREMWETVRAFLGELRGPLETACKRTKKCGEVLGALDAALDGAREPVRDAAGLSTRAKETAALIDKSIRERVEEWSASELGKYMAEDVGEAGEAIRAHAAVLAPKLDRYVVLDPELEGAARRIVQRLLVDVRRRLVAAGTETFGDLLRDARDLLAGDRDLCARLRATLDQVLVDEFQDTDPLQCELVRFIALDPDRGRVPGLLIVGDPKQSIYGWRRADLAAYDAFVDEVRARGGESHRLTLNFRSRQEILDHVEAVMSTAMVAEPGVQPQFQPLHASRPERGAELEHWNAWEYAEGRYARGETRTSIAARLEANCTARALVEANARGVEWKDMAVLMRAMTSVDVLLDALRDAGVPFDVAGDKSYYRRREVLDTAALLACIVDPGDHVALIGYLRSPWVGLPDAALIPLWRESFAMVAAELDLDRPETLARARAVVAKALAGMPRDVPRLDRVTGFEHALDHGLETLAMLRTSFRNDAVDTFLERARLLLLCEATSAARFQGVYRLANLERFFGELAAELETNGGDAQALLRFVRRAITSAPDAAEARPRDAGESAVSIMTIHKSKGLDFAHVYLVGLHRKSPLGRRDRHRTQIERDGHILFGAPTPGWFAFEDRAEKRERAEQVRLLYVAMTRAKDRLVMSGTWPNAPKDGVPRSPTTMMHHVEHTFPDEARAFFDAWTSTASTECRFGEITYRLAVELPLAMSAQDRSTPSRAVDDVRADSERLARARTAARTRSEQALVVPMSARHAIGDDDEWPQAEAKATRAPASASSIAGTAVHRALEQLPLGGDVTIALREARDGLAARVTRIAQETGATAEVAAEAVALAHAVHDAFVAGPAGARFAALAAHVVARELPVLAQARRDGGPVVLASGAIDLVYRDQDTRELVVVDYKTGAVPQGVASPSHTAQIAAYCAALKEALALDRMPRGELWYLAASRIDRVG